MTIVVSRTVVYLYLIIIIYPSTAFQTYIIQIMQIKRCIYDIVFIVNYVWHIIVHEYYNPVRCLCVVPHDRKLRHLILIEIDIGNTLTYKLWSASLILYLN